MDKLSTLFLSLREWFSSNYKFLLLSFLIACISFPSFKLTYASGSGIDNPLPWVYSYFADGNYTLGKNTLFPHGPLTFLLYPLPMGNNIFVAVFVYLACSLFLCMSLFKIHAKREQQNYPLVTILAILLLSFSDLQLVVIAITISQLLLFHLSSKKINLILTLFFCVFGLILKTYSGIVCCLLIAGFFFNALLSKNKLSSPCRSPDFSSYSFLLFGWL